MKNTFRNEVKFTEWAFDRIKEAFEKVAKDEVRKGSVTMSYLCPRCKSFPMEDNV